MPKFDWEDKDMRYSIAVFPWVGAVIGLVFYGIFYFGRLLAVPDIALALIMTAIPLIITGGFHIDGYMDTKDALSSFQPREEKLRILKDPHTGAFAVIWLGVCGLIYVGMLMIVLSAPKAEYTVAVLAMSFFLARCFSGFDVLLLAPAKKDGMLHHESGQADKARKINLTVLTVNLALVIAAMVITEFKAGILALIVAFLWNLLYQWRCKKHFGGITGDTAGYFVVKCELYIMVAAALLSLLLKIIV